jgi:hypothetical protein
MQEKKLKNNVPRGGMPVTITQGTTFFFGKLYAYATIYIDTA